MNDDYTFPLSDEQEFSASPFPPNTITFCIDNEEMIKLTKEGFFWKGNLVREDNEIMDRFIEFLNSVKQP